MSGLSRVARIADYQSTLLPTGEAGGKSPSIVGRQSVTLGDFSNAMLDGSMIRLPIVFDGSIVTDILLSASADKISPVNDIAGSSRSVDVQDSVSFAQRDQRGLDGGVAQALHAPSLEWRTTVKNLPASLWPVTTVMASDARATSLSVAPSGAKRYFHYFITLSRLLSKLTSSTPVKRAVQTENLVFKSRGALLRLLTGESR